jgi:anthranilate phosphoribosyltransferase
MKPHDALARVIEHREIFHEEMLDLMRQIMRGEVSPVLISAILLGLRVKKETLGEIAAAATVQREFATRVEVADTSRLVDTCGTGGDGAHTFNISTAAAFVAAAAGAQVAKHGGRSVSSRSGSADVLEALGVHLTLTPAQIARCIETDGLGFMFAPNHHGAMKHAAPVRRELGVRTLFNILGPLTNPAGAPNQVLGVFHPDLVGILVRVLQRLGSRHVLVVHGLDGLDELSLSGDTLVGELKDGVVREYVTRPGDFGLKEVSRSVLRADDAETSKALVLQALDGVRGPAQDIVALNAGAAIYAAGLAPTHRDGVERAFATIASGAARAKLDAFAARTRALAAESIEAAGAAA